MAKNIREDLKNFIVEKVKQSVTIDRPYMFIKWSGLYELCRMYNVDLLELIDELCKEKRLKKALIKNKLALTLPDMSISQKTRQLLEEFQSYLNRK